MEAVKEKPQEDVQEWIQTDDNQWTRKESKYQYLVIEAHESPLLNKKRKVVGNVYLVKKVEVNLNNFTISQIEKAVTAYYSDGLDEIIERDGNEWKQTVAICIAENEPSGYNRVYLKNQKKLDKHLKRLYDVEREY
ncbi:hypothetical protein CN918_30180 [Priestia megaterium]|nr:hypothetical protein CN918_30180 [Priestia megaterium]